MFADAQNSLITSYRNLSCCALPFLFLVFLLLTIAGTAATFLYYSQPTDLQCPRTITIPTGSSARAIGNALERKVSSAAGAFFHGQCVYRVSRTGSKQAPINSMACTIYLIRFNYCLKLRYKCARRQFQRDSPPRDGGVLARQGIVDSTRFVQLTADRTFTAGLGIDEPTLEGYLFPETYFFQWNPTKSQLSEG